MPAATVAPVCPSGVKPHQVEKHYTVRCFLYREKSGLFVAECVDLDLMVKARKQNMAMRALRDAVLGYVKVAVESGTDSTATLTYPRTASRSARIAIFCLRAFTIRSRSTHSATNKPDFSRYKKQRTV